MSRALLLWGGWDGHEPERVATIVAQALDERSFDVVVDGSLDRLDDPVELGLFDVVVPVWTMGTLGEDRQGRLCGAVQDGLGIAGCHAMADAFRDATDYQFMVGGQFVAHPGGNGVAYRVEIRNRAHPVTSGLPDFDIRTERYFLHVDPAIDILAATRIAADDDGNFSGRPFDMPVAWTRQFGSGRVFYCSLGHTPSLVASPPVLELVVRGIAWAARDRS